jgi:pimeloyl-ACP methyl ester carboxylesterase
VRTLCLLSGLLCDETIWLDVAQRIRQDLTIQILCFSGFSAIEAMASHVLQQVPDELVLAGHSMGGRVALEVVRQAPDRVTAIALLNTGVHPRGDSEEASRGRLVEIAKRQGMEALAAAWLPPMMGASPHRVAQVMPLLIDMVKRATPESFAGQIKALLERPDARAVLPTIHVPTLLVSSSADTWSPPAQHREMQKCIAHARYTTIDDAGHMSPIEQPAAVAAVIDQWLTNPLSD